MTTNTRFCSDGTAEAYLTHPEDNFRQALQQDAAKRFLETLGGVSTSYSRGLHDLQVWTDQQKALLQKTPVKTVVMDMDKFVVGLSFGLDEAAITRALLNEQGVTVDQDANLDLEVVLPHQLEPYVLMGLDCAGTAFGAWQLSFSANSQPFDLILPLLDYAPSYFNGCSDAESFTLVNLHESYHALDRHFLPATRVDEMLSYNPNVPNLYSDRLYRKKCLSLIKGEAFAYLGALGEMIRRGAGLDIIDWIDEAEIEDMGHQPLNICKGFKKEIQEKGVSWFRTLTPKASYRFCVETVRRHGPTDRVLKMAAALALDMTSPTGEKTVTEKSLLERRQAEDIATHLRRYCMNQGPTEDAPVDVSDLDVIYKEERIHLRAFDAAAEIKTHAVASGGALTPETMAQGFLAALDKRRIEKMQGGDQEILNAEMIKLQHVFLSNKVNYISENRQLGLDPVFAPDRTLRFVERENALLGSSAPVVFTALNY